MVYAILPYVKYAVVEMFKYETFEKMQQAFEPPMLHVSCYLPQSF